MAAVKLTSGSPKEFARLYCHSAISQELEFSRELNHENFWVSGTCRMDHQFTTYKKVQKKNKLGETS
jgi:hypothetical protein